MAVYGDNKTSTNNPAAPDEVCSLREALVDPRLWGVAMDMLAPLLPIMDAKGKHGQRYIPNPSALLEAGTTASAPALDSAL